MGDGEIGELAGAVELSEECVSLEKDGHEEDDFIELVGFGFPGDVVDG